VNGLVDVLAAVEAAGVALRLDGDKVCIRYQDELQREHVFEQVDFLRARREEVAEWLRLRGTIPPMPPGVRAHSWNLKVPPVAIDSCSIVTDCDLFARTTLEQLRVALAEPKRWTGWTLPQLIDRLRQVGVDIEVEEQSQLILPRRKETR
jgi:hypothetical protein